MREVGEQGCDGRRILAGKAAPAGKTLSEVAKGLGWSTSIWDFSGEVPVLKAKTGGSDSSDANGQLPDFDENEFYN